MIKLNDEKKVDVSLLEIQRPLSNELIKDYNHKEVMKEIHDIFLQLEDNFFYQVAYQEFLKYSIDENLEFNIIEDPRLTVKTFNSYEQEIKNDLSFKSFTRKDYRNSVVLCEALLSRVKDAFDNLDEAEKFIIKNFEYDKPKEYVDEALYDEMCIHKDKYYLSKKSAYIKMALQLGMMEELHIESQLLTEFKKYISKNIVTISN
jgi:hypothetical protein